MQRSAAVSVIAGAVFPVTCLVALAACTSRPIATPAPTGPASAAKVIVRSAGPYEIAPDAVAAAGIGWTGEMLARSGVTHRGQPVASWIVGQPDAPRLRFYAGPLTSTVTAAPAEDVYWLEPGAPRAADGSDVGTVVVSATVDSGLAAARTEGVLVEAREQPDLEYVPLRPGDPWVWTGLTAPVTASFGLTLSHVLPHAAQLEAHLWTNVESPSDMDHHWRLAVKGNREDGDHEASGSATAQVVADSTWDGVGEHVITATLRPGLLGDGANAVSLIGPGDLDLVDKVYLDSLVLRYRRDAVPDDGGRLAWLGDRGAVALAGFKEPLTVLDISQPLGAREAPSPSSSARQGTVDQVVFQTQPVHAYVAVGADGWRAPARIEGPVFTPDLRAIEPPDYVAIGPADLLAPLDPLVAAHRQAGLTVETVDMAAIVDQFGFGLSEPEAIRAFLAELRRRAAGPAGAPSARTPPGAATASSHRPRFVLLVGDASYDLRPAASAAKANRVPTFLVDTVFGGQTASDELFAELTADAGPVMAVGRVPARTPDEVKAWVAKTVAHLRQRLQPAATSMVMTVADPSEAMFGADAASFGDQLRSAPCGGCAPLDVAPVVPAVTGDVVGGGGGSGSDGVGSGDGDGVGSDGVGSGGGDGVGSGSGDGGDGVGSGGGDGGSRVGGGGGVEPAGSGATGELMAAHVAAALGSGPALVAYFGHGSITQWGKDGLLTVDAVREIRAADPSRLPVYLNFTCLTGLFTHPRVTSLAETLLFAPDGGAVAVLAPTSLTLPSDQHALTGALASTLASGLPLGEQLLAAWRAVPVDLPESRDVRRTFLLFGDPALVVMPGP